MTTHKSLKNRLQTQFRTPRTKALTAIGIIAVILVAIVVSLSPKAKADQFDVQINALNAQIAQNQAAASQKASEANTLANKVAILNSQIAAAQADLNKTNVEISKTNAQIDAANKDLDHQKSVLKDNLRTIYKQGEVSPIEVVASSKDLSDFVAQQEYLTAIKKKIDDNLKKIDALKKELDAKKSNLTTLQSQQQAKTDNVNAQKAQQASLLAQTQGDEAKYKGIAAAQSAQVSSLKAQQQAAFARIYSGGSSGGGGTSGYSGFSQCGGGYHEYLCNAPQDALVDQWGLYSRECVSYAAWAMQYRFGHSVPHFNGQGNANQWPDYLRNKGYRVDHNPEVGSVAITYIGSYGHAMVVESVSGAQVHVSQYNWWPTSSGPGGLYSTMNINASSVSWFIHF